MAEGTTVEYGSVRALWEVVERLGLVEVIDKVAPKRNGISIGRLVAFLAVNRCRDPMAKWKIPAWLPTTYLPELSGVELPEESGYQTLTRALEYLTDDVQQDIELEVARNTLEKFGLKPESWIYDLTSTFVEGEGAAPILQYGYSRDHRPDRKQINYALCVDMPHGVPFFHKVFPGNTVDSKTVKDTMVLFKDRLGLDGCLVVDRGIVTQGNVEEIVDERGLDLVGGVRMDVGLKPRIARISLERYGPAFTRGEETLRAFELPLKMRGKVRRGILYFSEAKAARDKKAREKALVDVGKKMGEIAASLSREGRGRRPEGRSTRRKIERLLEERHCEKLVKWKFTGGRGGRRLKWEADAKAVNAAEKLDGKYVLVTTLDKTPEEILELYRARARVEQAFRITKESIRIRPIWNRKELHIKAHVFVCYLAYLLLSLIQLLARKVEPGITALRALEEMARVTKRVDRVLPAPRGGRKLLRGMFGGES